jgi:hypothetical protein
MSKGRACMAGLCMICLFGVMSFIWPDRAASLDTIMTAIGLLTGGYFAVQVADNGVKGKFFNQAYYDAEHKEEKNNELK